MGTWLHFLISVGLGMGFAYVAFLIFFLGALLVTDNLRQLPPELKAILFFSMIGSGYFIPRLIFKKLVPARCPVCRGKTYMQTLIGPVTYLCSDCGHFHLLKLLPGVQSSAESEQIRTGETVPTDYRHQGRLDELTNRTIVTYREEANYTPADRWVFLVANLMISSWILWPVLFNTSAPDWLSSAAIGSLLLWNVLLLPRHLRAVKKMASEGDPPIILAHFLLFFHGLRPAAAESDLLFGCSWMVPTAFVAPLASIMIRVLYVVIRIISSA